MSVSCQMCNTKMSALQPQVVADEKRRYYEDYYCLECHTTLTIEIDDEMNYKSIWVVG